MAAAGGRWIPCGGCKGCADELEKDSAKAEYDPFLYCPSAKWTVPEPDPAAKKTRRRTAKGPRKLSKKRQLWDNYHKQQDNAKKANFFKPKTKKAPPPIPPPPRPKADDI